MADTLDSLYGRPGAALRRSFQAGVRRILAVDSWDAFFAAVGLLRPTPDELTALLRQSWKNSLFKGYHRQVRGNCPLTLLLGLPLGTRPATSWPCRPYLATLHTLKK